MEEYLVNIIKFSHVGGENREKNRLVANQIKLIHLGMSPEINDGINTLELFCHKVGSLASKCRIILYNDNLLCTKYRDKYSRDHLGPTTKYRLQDRPGAHTGVVTT